MRGYLHFYARGVIFNSVSFTQGTLMAPTSWKVKAVCFVIGCLITFGLMGLGSWLLAA